MCQCFLEVKKIFKLRTILPDDDDILGTAGGPITDEEGYVIWIGEVYSVDQFDGEEKFCVVSTK